MQSFNRAQSLNKSSLLTPVTPTRILESAKLHIDKATPSTPDDAKAVFQYKSKQELKAKYAEWMYNAVLQQ